MRIFWPQPGIVEVAPLIDMLTCPPCLVPGRRGLRLVGSPIAESRGAARRLLRQAAVRVSGRTVRDERHMPDVDRTYAPARKWLACDVAPPLGHPQHVGWLEVGRTAIRRIVACPPGDFEGVHLV